MRVAMLLPCLLIVLSGCGRFAFDPTNMGDASGIDALACGVGHDEDTDGIDDGCDVCPHLPDPQQTDRDGDGVGDICDPRPDVPGEHIVFFDSYATDLGAWTFANFPPTQGSDVMIADTRLGQLRAYRPAALTTDRIEIAGHVGGHGAGQRQVLIEADEGPGAPPSYYCEVDGDDVQNFIGLTYTPDLMNYNVLFTKPVMPPFVDGDYYLRLDTSPTVVGCNGTWNGEPTGGSDTPPATVPAYLGLKIQGVDATVRWMIQIHSD